MENEADLITRVRNAPKRKLHDVEKQLLLIFIEKSKVGRERALSLLSKGFLLFLVMAVIAYFGRDKSILGLTYTNFLLVIGVVILVLAVIGYELAIKKENEILDRLLESYLR